MVEASYSYGGVVTPPRLVRVDAVEQFTEIARGTNPPWNGVTYQGGAFYIAGGHLEGGHILRVLPDGTLARLVEGLPSYGDHHTNGPVAAPDGHLYFGQGTVTNSACAFLIQRL